MPPRRRSFSASLSRSTARREKVNAMQRRRVSNQRLCADRQLRDCRAHHEAFLDLHGGRWSTNLWQQVESARASFGRDFSAPGSVTLWTAPLGTENADELSAAISLGCLRARLQHAVAEGRSLRRESAFAWIAREGCLLCEHQPFKRGGSAEEWNLAAR